MINPLKDSGFKNTEQRRKILEALQSSGNKHLSAEELYSFLKKNNEEVSLATVYRVLTQFAAAGIVIKHNFEDNHAVFELAVKDHHDHLICKKCGVIIEFFDQTLENRQLKIAKQHDFLIINHSLSISGICTKCKKS